MLRRRKHQVKLFAEPSLSGPKAGSDFATLHHALGRLPEKYRLPLLLYYFDGQSTENIARTLNMSAAGAGTRLSRARRELRRILQQQRGDGYE